MPPESAIRPAAKGARPENAALLYGWDVFVSFALGPPPRGSRSYASDLARQLRERGYTVFFSEEEAAPGAALDASLKRALHRARCLVVIANRGTLADPRWVRTEVEEYRRVHPDRPIIPISIDGALTDPELESAAEAWLGHGSRIWIDESAEAFAEGVASAAVVERLIAAPRLSRASVRWRRTVAAAFSVLGALALTAAWFGWSQYVAGREARSGLLAAQSQLARANDPTLALLLAAHGWRTAPTPAARSALAAALGAHPYLVAQLDRVLDDTGHERNIRSLRFSADGARLYALAGTPRAAEVLVGWDVATRRPLPLTTPAGLRPAAFAAHPEGRVIVALAQPGDPATVLQLWDVEAARFVSPPLDRLPDGLEPSILLTPDGRHLAIAGGGPPQLQIRSPESGEPLLERLADEQQSSTRILLAADRKAVHGLTVGARLHRWSLADWSPVHPPIELEAVHSILQDGFAASSDGRWLALGGKESQPLLWELAQGKSSPWTFPGHTDKLTSLEFSADSSVLASASADGTVRLWNVGTPEVRFDPRPLAAHQGIVREAVFSPARGGPRLLATGGSDGRVLLWNIDSAPPLARGVSKADDKTVAALAFAADGGLLLAGRRNVLEAWSTGIGEAPPRRLWALADAHRSDIDGIASLPDGGGAISLSGFARELKRWTLKSDGADLAASVAVPERVQAMAAAPASREVVLQTPNALFAYRASDLTAVGQAAPPTGTRFAEIAAGPGVDEVMVGTADGRLLVYGPGLSLRGSLPARGDMPLALAGDAGSGQIAAVTRGRNDAVTIWPHAGADAQGVTVRVEGRPGTTVSVLAAASDGRTLLGGGIGFTALWDLHTRGALGTVLPGHRNGPKSVATNPRTPLVATGSYNGEILLWDLDADRWAEAACRLANRNLSCWEWRAVQGNRAWEATCPSAAAPRPACR